MHTTISTRRSSGRDVAVSWRETIGMSKRSLHRSLVPIFFDDVEQRLALEVGIERQRAVRQAIAALEIGRHPRVAIAYPPRQDRLGAHHLENRTEKIIRHCRDKPVALADIARQ